MARSFSSVVVGLVLFGWFLATPLVGRATEDIPGKRTAVAFTEKFPEPYPMARLSAALDEQSGKLASLQLSLAGKPVDISRKAFDDLAKPNLKTISLSYSGRPVADPKWSVAIRIEFGDPVRSEQSGGRYEFSYVAIMIVNGRAVGREIFPIDTPGSSRHDEF